MDPNSGYNPAGFPVPTQSPSNPMSFYPNQQFPQSKPPSQPGQQQHSFGSIPMQPGVPGGAMMPSGFPQQSSAPMENFSAPFSQPPLPANMAQFSQANPAPNTPSTVAQTFSQNMASISANNLLANQPRAQVNSPRSAQPGTPNMGQVQGQVQPQQAQQSQTQMQGPSPAQIQAQAQAMAREKVRMTTLLDINSTLLEEIVNLQMSGKAGSGSNDGTIAPQKPSQEYVDCMRRLQANLSYLASITDKQKRLPAPALMTPPPSMPILNESYQKLNELFPRSSQAPTPQRFSPAMMQGNGGPSPSPMPESLV
ncbi:hypothetical protein N7466_005725 [Penicillium verhagenii]|uniref:uncharacterized protein n=1 Tax=Penicillium verhagenii TaxID=1562060 RepID=UPI002545BD06|nr:uncharacterized protein N7466_005725 [Penicillium verhagenii]KAJ5930232.1 hypothetical protein N7466_005725 [Penicillium verhagenii]